jgi:hypothetical protein
MFVGEVLGAIRDRDRAAARETMAASFQYMVEATDVFLPPASARTAARQLFAGVPDPDGNTWFIPVGRPRLVRCVGASRPRDLGESQGFWPTQWDVAVEVTGLGADGDATGWLMIGTGGDGRPVWRGLLFGFPGVDLWG